MEFKLSSNILTHSHKAGNGHPMSESVLSRKLWSVRTQNILLYWSMTSLSGVFYSALFEVQKVML